MKTCPYCVEEIQDAAIVCRHCGRDLPGISSELLSASTPPPSQPNPPSPGVAAVLSLLIPGAGQMYAGRVVAGLGWLIVTAIGYFLYIIPGLILHLIGIFSAYATAEDSSPNATAEDSSPKRRLLNSSENTTLQRGDLAEVPSSRRRLLNLALSLVVSGGFLYLAFRNVALDELGVALGRVQLGWLCLAVVVSLLIMVMRAWRWQLELRPLEYVPVGRLWVVTSVAYMAIQLLPVRLGEVVRPWLLSRRSQVSISNVIGNLVVEKMMDSICIVFYLLAGLLLIESLPVWVRRGALVPAAIAAVFVSVVILFWWKGEAFVDRWVLRWLTPRLGDRVKGILAAITDGMRILPNPGLLLAVFVVSLLVWFLPIVSSYIMIRAFDLSAPFSAALVIFIFISFGTALPNLPGMIGPYQYACQLALGIYGVSAADGLAYGLVLNAVQFLTLIGQGLIALPIAGVSFSDIRQAGDRLAKRKDDES